MLDPRRIYFDDIDNMPVLGGTVGFGRLGLRFDVNDMRGIMIEENVMSAAAARNLANDAELRHLIQDGGFIPRQRTTLHELYAN